jgi:hypothetical protein
MIAEAQVTTRNAGLLVVQRGAQVASGFLFAMLIPRLMGADTYGQYALVTSLALWFVLASNLGFTQVIARYVPEFMLSDDKPGMQAFFGGLLTVRLASGVLAAALLLLLTVLWLRELDRLALAFVAGVVVVRVASHLFFALFLGLNQAARWGMEAVVRGWVSLTVLLLALSSVGRLLALVYDQPGVALTAEGARLAALDGGAGTGGLAGGFRGLPGCAGGINPVCCLFYMAHDVHRALFPAHVVPGHRPGRPVPAVDLAAVYAECVISAGERRAVCHIPDRLWRNSLPVTDRYASRDRSRVAGD